MHAFLIIAQAYCCNTARSTSGMDKVLAQAVRRVAGAALHGENHPAAVGPRFQMLHLGLLISQAC